MKNFFSKYYIILCVFLMPVSGFAQDCVFLGCAGAHGTQITNASATMIEAPSDFTCYEGYSFRQITWQYFYSPSGGNFVQGYTSINETLDLDWLVFDAGTTMPSTTCPINTDEMTLIACSTTGSEGETAGPGYEGSAVTTTAGHYYLVGVTFWQDTDVSWEIGSPTLGGNPLTTVNCPAGGNDNGPNSERWLLSGNSGINAANNFAGTTDNKQLLLKSNTKPGVRIDTSGNISIGDTVNAVSKLYLRPAATGSSAFTVRARTGQSGSTYLQEWQKNDGSSIMRISGLGKIGIGTSSFSDSSFNMFVESGIRTRKVKVDPSTWADYVFDSNYRLRTVEETRQFTELHNHLPGVPSAEEVIRTGLDVGDNQALLLSKIEELTLYMIERDKQINQLQRELDELMKRKSSKTQKSNHRETKTVL